MPPSADTGRHVSCSEGSSPKESIEVAEKIIKDYKILPKESDIYKTLITNENRVFKNIFDNFILLDKQFKLGVIRNLDNTVQATHATVIGTAEPIKGTMLCLDVESTELREFIKNYDLSPLLKEHDEYRARDKQKGINPRGKYYDLHITLEQEIRNPSDSLLKAVKSLELKESFLQDYYKIHDDAVQSPSLGIKSKR